MVYGVSEITETIVLHLTAEPARETHFIGFFGVISLDESGQACCVAGYTFDNPRSIESYAR